MEVNQLRQGAIESILRELDQSILTRHAFLADFNNDKTGEILSFIFRENDSFRFAIKSPNNETDSWYVTESPGEYLLGDQVSNFEDFLRCKSRINAWVQRIIQELTTIRTNADLQAYRENLEKVAQSLPNPDQPFSVEEAVEWSAKFDDLVSELEKVKDKLGIQEGEINRLKSDLKTLQGSIHSIPKKTWVAAAGNKLLNVIEPGFKVGIKMAIESVVKGLLGSGDDGK